MPRSRSRAHSHDRRRSRSRRRRQEGRRREDRHRRDDLDRSRSRDPSKAPVRAGSSPPASQGKGGGKGLPGSEELKGKGKGKGKEKGKSAEGAEPPPAEPKEEPNFEASGLLAMEDNSKNGIALKFTAPPEARMPDLKWRLYIYKGSSTTNTEPLKVLHIHRLQGVLFGKDRRVADVPTDHATCSKQHAVLHYRQMGSQVKPYILDLESTNGTFLNGERLESARYFELKEQDVLKFGMSSREHVLLHAGSANHIKIDPKDLEVPSD